MADNFIPNRIIDKFHVQTLNNLGSRSITIEMDYARVLNVLRPINVPIYVSSDGATSLDPIPSSMEMWIEKIEKMLKRVTDTSKSQVFMEAILRTFSIYPIVTPVAPNGNPAGPVDNTILIKYFNELWVNLNLGINRALLPYQCGYTKLDDFQERMFHNPGQVEVRVDQIVDYLKKLPDIFAGKMLVFWLFTTFSDHPQGRPDLGLLSEIYKTPPEPMDLPFMPILHGERNSLLGHIFVEANRLARNIEERNRPVIEIVEENNSDNEPDAEDEEEEEEEEEEVDVVE